MSMTQEEIEALMNDTASEPETNVNDILAGIDGIVEDDESVEEEVNVDDLLAGIDGIVDNDSEDEESEVNVDDILAGIDGIVDDEPEEEPETNVDDILAGIDGIVDDEPAVQEKPQEKEEAILPLPSSKEHKIVNQLNEVAEDTEEKASQIFDVLSYILDENEKLTTSNDATQEFITTQIELLEKLTSKFPNIEVLKENLAKANEVKELSSQTNDIINEENNKIFEAMEIMQYHDINRQKIERVMAVIRKLTQYLNGLFEDDSNKPEVQIAKHISGDGSTETVDEDDINNLISEFNSEI
jgi:hypothetical protein